MKIIELIKLLRINQWYKNLLVFLALIFSNELFNKDLLFMAFLGFISLCLISSANYIINDIMDRKRDKEHPEKKFRPIASGKVKIFEALILGFITFIIGLTIASRLSSIFLLSVISIFILTLLYSVYLKKILFLDIIIVSINFVIRAISGTFIINRVLSPWLILCPFFLALFLIVGKRQADLNILGASAFKHKEVLKYYKKEINNILMIVSTTLLIMSYSLYAFLGEHKKLLLTLPVAIYVILRYIYLVYSNSEIARKPNLIYKDKELVIGILIWALLVALILYLPFSTYEIIYPSQFS